MGYFLSSIWTRSFWSYALASKAAFSRVFTAVGVIYAGMEVLDFFGIYERTNYAKWALVPILAIGIVYAILRVRPVKRVSYKVPGRDLNIEVKIGDVLEATGEIVVSSSTTFDTDMASGLISTTSLQGQFATRFFEGKTQAIDEQLSAALEGITGVPKGNALGKSIEYPVGTVARVNSHGNNYYFVAMSKLNDKGNAYSDLRMIDVALDELWKHIMRQGDFATVSVPLIGTGRGRIGLPRKKMIERIAQSFVDASKDQNFSNHLVIYVHPDDAARFELNLFEVRDYLTQSLHG